MTVAELIAFLQTMPQDLQVAYSQCSEQCVMEQEDIYVVKACVTRPDGWIQNRRPDKETQDYLMLPGN